jgi:hypothetical protein
MVKGPWDDLPAPKPPPREPLLKPRARREPLINNWRLFAILLVMIFIMPAVVRWLYFTLVGMFMGPG